MTKMKKLIIGMMIILGMVCVAEAQKTSVSATITDPSGIPNLHVIMHAITGDHSEYNN